MGFSQKEKAKKDDEETSTAQLLKEMREDIREIKSDNKEIKENLTDMNHKIDKIETKQKENEDKTNAEFKEIRNEMQAKNREIQEMKQEMKTNNSELEKKLTLSVVETLKPKIREIERSSKDDLRNIIREEIASRLEEEADGEATDANDDKSPGE